MWQFPHCVGAFDGKHIEIQAPHDSGSLFFNYKKIFSVFLLALIDANYKFTITVVGGYNESSDGGLLKSVLEKSLEADALNIPNSKPPPNSEEPLPVVIEGDVTFPLKKYVLRPYPGVSTRNDEIKKIYNYRLSRACRVVENAFGIHTKKCGLFFGRIRLSPANAAKIILAACVLHSNLRNDISTKDNVTENTDAPLQSQHFTVPE